MIITLVLLGQVLELRARARHPQRIRALLDLAPPTARRADDGREEDDSRSIKCNPATACASAPVKTFPWTVSYWKAPALWTNPWSPASPCRWKNRRRQSDGRHREWHRKLRHACRARRQRHSARANRELVARRSGAAPPFSGWQTRSPGFRSGCGGHRRSLTFIVWALVGPNRAWRTALSTPWRC